MEYDFAIVYFGLTRSTKKVFMSHIEKIFEELHHHGKTFKIFMHTWRTNDNRQKIWETISPIEIDYLEFKLLNPDFYKIDNQDEFLENINMDHYFYKDVWETMGVDGEWLPGLVKNHICALESTKRGLEMVEGFVKDGNRFQQVMFIRPDVFIKNKLPLHEIRLPYEICIPDENHFEGLNDRFAIVQYDKASLYGKRIDEIAEFRKTNGRIVSEKYVKFIIEKYKLKLNLIPFSFDIIRP